MSFQVSGPYITCRLYFIGAEEEWSQIKSFLVHDKESGQLVAKVNHIARKYCEVEGYASVVDYILQHSQFNKWGVQR